MDLKCLGKVGRTGDTGIYVRYPSEHTIGSKAKESRVDSKVPAFGCLTDDDGVVPSCHENDAIGAPIVI